MGIKESKKARPRKPLPKWVAPLVSVVLVLAIVVGALALIWNNNGFFKRHNILVKSQTSGKYSINQQMAYFLVWNYYYEQASETWDYYENAGYSNIMSYILGASTKLDYCWGQSMSAAQDHLNTTVSSSTLLQSYVALCDYGQKNGMKLTKAEKEQAISNMYQTLRSRAYDYYDYLADNGYSVTPSNVYYGNYLEFGRWWKTVFGTDFKEVDMEKSAAVLALSQKVLSYHQNEVWEATDANAEKLANPNRYYKTDYVTYSTTDAELAALLAEVNTEEALKDLIVNYYIEDNYLELYNKYVTGKVDEAEAVYTALGGKTTEAEQNAALALYDLSFTEYTEGENALDEKVAEWIFDSARKGFDSTKIALDDKVVIVVIEGTDPVEEAAEAENTEEAEATESTPKKVKAAIYTVNYLAIDEAGMAKLKNTVRLALELTDDETLAHYHSAAEEAKELADALKAEDADKDSLLAGATEITDVHEDEAGVPSAIRMAVFAEGVEIGNVLTVEDDGKVYVVLVTDLKAAVPADEEKGISETPALASFSYKTFSEPMNEVASELETGAKAELEKVSEETASYLKPAAVEAQELLAKLNASYNKKLFMTNNGATSKTDVTAANKPDGIEDTVYTKALAMKVGEAELIDIADSTAKYLIYIAEQTETGLTVYYLKVETYEIDTYSEWLFSTAKVENGEYVSGVAEGEVKVIEKKADSEDEETTYSYYLVKNAPMYLKKDPVVRGGYLTYMGTDAQVRAEAAKNALAGKTGYDLLKSLAETESDNTAVASNAITEDSITSTAVSEWLFDETRSANEVVVLEEGGVYYVVAFGARMESWASSAKANAASEDSGEWIQKLIVDGGYKVSEKALKKIKDKKEEETTEETTEASADDGITVV